MPEYLSKERVERDGVLLYPEGWPIPESDVAELVRQGFVKKSESKAQQPGANKARKPAADK